MDQAGIQTRIDRGMGIAARFLGAAHAVYRPSGPSFPLATGNSRGTLACDFDQDPQFRFGKPSLYGKPVSYLLGDSTSLQAGDYLTGPRGTWFLAAVEPNKPRACVECNTVVDILRGATQAQDGLNTNYAGRTDATDTVLMQHWPASVLEGGRTEAGQVDLPADPRMTGVIVLLPAVPGLLIRTSDRVVDDQGRAHTVGSAELTSLGWRLRAVSAAT